MFLRLLRDKLNCVLSCRKQGSLLSVYCRKALTPTQMSGHLYDRHGQLIFTASVQSNDQSWNIYDVTDYNCELREGRCYLRVDRAGYSFHTELDDRLADLNFPNVIISNGIMRA